MFKLHYDTLANMTRVNPGLDRVQTMIDHFLTQFDEYYDDYDHRYTRELDVYEGEGMSKKMNELTELRTNIQVCLDHSVIPSFSAKEMALLIFVFDQIKAEEE